MVKSYKVVLQSVELIKLLYWWCKRSKVVVHMKEI